MKSYITTPIFYVNAHPHLGHAYTSVVADTCNRYRNLIGAKTRFQTGTDEHGDKIAEAAEKNDMSPKEYADAISKEFQETWPPLQVKPDNFIRTTNVDHIATVQAILQKIYDQGDISFSDYTGLYCTGCERFLTEKELVDGKCPDHKTEPEEIKEKNYFFKMSRYQEWLIDHIQNNPDFITPERYRNEVLAFLKEPLEDLCISRPTSRLTWGIPLPFDNNFVTYVWFDALINYLSGLGYCGDSNSSHLFDEFWPVAEHVIAKDILKPHAIFWPTMLKAMGVEPYKHLHVHGYWNIDDTKMSKSLGNIVKPLDLVSEYGVDTVRYFLLREMSFGLDSSFSNDALLRRRNSDLANDLGNLVSRTMAMVKKFTDGCIPAQPQEELEIDEKLREKALLMLSSYRKNMDTFSFNKAIADIWEVIGEANRYIVENAPWELAKSPESKGRLNGVIYNLLEVLRIIALPLIPIMPESAGHIFKILAVKGEITFAAMGHWGGFLVSGTELSFSGSLFPRMDINKSAGTDKCSGKQAESSGKAKKKKLKSKDVVVENSDGLIDYEDFSRLDLRVATIVSVERIKKSDRLLKLTVNVPEERVIVAGIAEFYEPEDLIGKQVLVVANLKPVKLMGVKSHGMVMAAKSGEKLVLASVSDHISPGSKVS